MAFAGRIQSPDFCPLEVGFPIRISADQSLFAAPHGFSQRTTSFIACACQGIHRTPLRHLIALIINARPFRALRARERTAGIQRPEPRKDRVPPIPPQTAIWTTAAPPSRRHSWKDQCHTRTARRRGGQASPAFAHSLRPVRNGRNVRTTLLFTMSANRQPAPSEPLQTFISCDKHPHAARSGL